MNQSSRGNIDKEMPLCPAQKQANVAIFNQNAKLKSDISRKHLCLKQKNPDSLAPSKEGSASPMGNCRRGMPRDFQAVPYSMRIFTIFAFTNHCRRVL